MNLKDIAKGIKLCYLNAKELLEESQVLLDNSKYRGAVNLVILAAEETSKISKIFNLLDTTKTEGEKLKSFKGKFFKHDDKIISFFTDMMISDLKETNGKRFFNKAADGKVINKNIDLCNVRIKSLYVDFDFKSKEFIPPLIITKELAEEMVGHFGSHFKSVYERKFEGLNIDNIANLLQEHESIWTDPEMIRQRQDFLNKLSQRLENK